MILLLAAVNINGLKDVVWSTFQLPDWLRKAYENGSSAEFPGKGIVQLAIGELI